MSKLKYWLLALRPKTLTAALVPIICTTALVHSLGYQIHWWISILAFVSSLFIQFATNLINDASDFKKGADKEGRLGPMRVTQSGVFTHNQVLGVGILFLVLAAVCGLPLVIHGGWPILLIGVLSLFCAYAYTAGPFPLAYNGLGDLFVILFFGLFAVCGLFYLHTTQWPLSAMILGLQIGFHCTTLIAINNLRDVDSDVLVHKKTLPVRFGKKFARYEVAFLTFTPFILNLYWFFTNHRYYVFLTLITLPIAIKLVRLVFKTEPSAEYNQFLAKSAALHLLFGVILSLGLVL